MTLTDTTFSHEELLAALERFDWLADEMRDAIGDTEAAGLQRVLHDGEARVSAKERALVSLALLGSSESRAVLRWFEPHGEHRRVQLLHRLALRECDNRRRRSVGDVSPSARRVA